MPYQTLNEHRISQKNHGIHSVAAGYHTSDGASELLRMRNRPLHYSDQGCKTSLNAYLCSITSYNVFLY